MRNEVASKLELLREYVDILRGYQKHSLADLKKDVTLRGAVERYLEIALECVLDIGEMVILREGLRKPETYREVIEILGENGILPKNFAENFKLAAGFRNILVHMYALVSIEKVHKFLQHNLKDFDRFARAIAKYIENRRKSK